MCKCANVQICHAPEKSAYDIKLNIHVLDCEEILNKSNLRINFENFVVKYLKNLHNYMTNN